MLAVGPHRFPLPDVHFSLKVVPVFANLFTNEPLPDSEGYLHLDENKHGWGVELNKKELKLQRPYARAQN